MGISLDAANALEAAIDKKISAAASRETRANGTVTRVDEDGQAYVMLDGSEVETPVTSTTAAVHEGERVVANVSDGELTVDGNMSAPATDDTAAHKAMDVADSALDSAAQAASAAASAVENAAIAEQAAQGAQDALQSVVTGATTVEKAVSVMQTALEAVIDYDPDEDEVTEYFWHDANGAHVLGDESGYRNDIDSSGMDIKQVSTEKSVAQFGASGARIGKAYASGASDNESHFELDYHSMQLIDRDGNTYFYVSDRRDADGYVTDEFIGDGTTKRFNLTMYAAGTDYEVEVDDVPVSQGITKNHNYVSFSDAPQSDSVITVKFDPAYDYAAKAYTFGMRKPGKTIGAMSVAEGNNNIASGSYSHAEGINTQARKDGAHSEGDSTTADGLYSHAEGAGGTVASGNYSHAEGYGVCTYGVNSHAQNERTDARGRAQTVIGTANVRDTSSTTTHPSGDVAYCDYAFIIGNGTADNARSDALRVDWSGNVLMDGDVQDMSGNQLYADASHEHSAADITSGALARANGGTGIDNIGYFNTTNNGTDYTAAAANTWYQACAFTIPAGSGILFGRLAMTTGSTAGYAYAYLTSMTLDEVKADPPDYNTTSLGLRIIRGTGTSEHKDVIIAVPYNIAQNTVYYLHWKSISTSTIYRTGTIRYLKLADSY